MPKEEATQAKAKSKKAQKSTKCLRFSTMTPWTFEQPNHCCEDLAQLSAFTRTSKNSHNTLIYTQLFYDFSSHFAIII
jgi:hypothetical protein